MVNMKVIGTTLLYTALAVAGAVSGKVVGKFIPQKAIVGPIIGIGITFASRASAKIPLAATMFGLGWTSGQLADSAAKMVGA